MSKIKWGLVALMMLVGGLLAVLAPGFADYAKHPFWWNFWIVMAVLGGLAFIGGFVLIAKGSAASAKEDQPS